MTISSEKNRVVYDGNGSTVAFSVPFRFLAPGDLVVLLRNVAAGTDAVQVLDTDYSVAGEGSSAGGTVTFLIEDQEPAVGEQVVIYADPGLTQTLDLTSGDSLPAESLEQAMDLLTLQQKRTRELVERAPRLVEGDTDGSGTYDANLNRIKRLGTPTATTDAATKAYVDATVTDTIGPIPTSSASVTATGASTSRTLADRFGELFNVKDHGALGNGSTNDAVAIQAAIDRVNAAGGGTLHFPQGTYVCNATLVGKSNVRLHLSPGTTLDFSGLGDFQNGSTLDGLIRVDGALGTPVALSSNATVDRTDQTIAAINHGLAVGDLALIYSNATRQDDDGSEQVRSGEMVYVKNVVDANSVMLTHAIHETYATADSAHIVKVTPISNFHIEGGRILGQGGNLPNYGDRGIWMNYVSDFSIVGVEFVDTDFECILMYNCVDGTVADCTMNKAFVYTAPGIIQYGVAYGMASHGLTIVNNKIYSGRHAIAQTNTSTAGYYGISRNIGIHNNLCFGQLTIAITTHQGVEGLTITGNTCTSSTGGVNVRYGKDTLVADNRIINCQDGVVVYRHAESIKISGNYMTVDRYGVLCYTFVTASSEVFTGGLTITDNTIYGTPAMTQTGPGVYVSDLTSGRTANDICVDNNVIVGMGDQGIRVEVGDAGETADGWTGSVRNNYMRNIGLEGTVQAIHLINPKLVPISGNVIIEGSGTLTRGIYVAGSGASSCKAFHNIVDGTAIEVDFTTGTGHETDGVTGDSLTIASGVVTLVLKSDLQLTVDTEGSAATDNLDTINGGKAGQRISVQSTSAARVPTLTEAGNLKLAGTFALDAGADRIFLEFDGTNWFELARSSNA